MEGGARILRGTEMVRLSPAAREGLGQVIVRHGRPFGAAFIVQMAQGG